MNIEDANELISALEDEGYEASLYEGYSGRGMFGDTTYGVTSDARPDDARAVAVRHGLDGFRTDNMGLDYIYY